MYVARMVCSDPACAAEIAADAARLELLEALVCDCGCALAVIAWPDWVSDAGGAVVELLRDAA